MGLQTVAKKAGPLLSMTERAQAFQIWCYYLLLFKPKYYSSLIYIFLFGLRVQY